MERNFEEKLKQDQIDRLTLKKEEVKFLTKEEVEKLQKKYSTFNENAEKNTD